MVQAAECFLLLGKQGMSSCSERPTLIDLHLSDSLPPVHRHEPFIFLSPTAKVDDKFPFVATETDKDGF